MPIPVVGAAQPVDARCRAHTQNEPDRHSATVMVGLVLSFQKVQISP